jgi:hypothetical protein
MSAQIAVTIVSLLVSHGLDNECRNPLFETHWYGKTDIPTLNSIPTQQTTLTRCPQFNLEANCCNTALEEEQVKYFNYFKDMIFLAKLVRVGIHNASVADVRNTAEYTVATHTDREQFNLALERFNPVLHSSVHAECFSALLTFAAGINCFVCRADWFDFVTQDHDVVSHVHVQPRVCMELWEKCEAFGIAAARLKQALLDSALAKQAKRQAENLDMFFNQQSLCGFLHNEVALHPFHRPSEADREAALMRANSQEVRRLQQVGDKVLDVWKMGMASGFDLSWPTERSQSSASMCLTLILMIVWAHYEFC